MNFRLEGGVQKIKFKGHAEEILCLKQSLHFESDFYFKIPNKAILHFTILSAFISAILSY